MTTGICTLRVALLLGLCSAMGAAAFAGPGTGELQARIDAVEAGAVLRLESGEYAGPIRIGKPLTLIGTGQPVIDGGHEGHVVHILAPDVRIEGFIVRGSGSNLMHDHAGIMVEGDRAVVAHNRIEDSLHGIYLKRSHGSQVIGNDVRGKTEKLVPVEDVMAEGLRLTADGELCYVGINVNQRGNGIHLWNSTGNHLEDNEIQHTRDGMYFSFTDRTTARGNFVHHVRYGLHYMYSDENLFENNRFEQNAAGAAVMYSKGLFVRGNTFANNRGQRAYGMLLQSIEDTTFLGNELRQNTIGIYLENGNRNHFYENAVQANYIGVRFTASSLDNHFSRNRFVRNLHSVELDRDSTGNDWAPGGVGNFWDGAQPVDLDGDGSSEFAHREADLLGAHRRDFPLAGLLTQTPALQLVEFVQSRVPLPGISAITDPAPLARTPSKPARD